MELSLSYSILVRHQHYRRPGQQHKISNTAIGVLKCPDDNTTQVNQGNLSYVVNGGFALWHAVPVRLGELGDRR